jgi:hypothetical protein
LPLPAASRFECGRHVFSRFQAAAPGAQSAPGLVTGFDDSVYMGLQSSRDEGFCAAGAPQKGLMRLPIHHLDIMCRNFCLDGSGGAYGHTCPAGYALFRRLVERDGNAAFNASPDKRDGVRSQGLACSHASAAQDTKLIFSGNIGCLYAKIRCKRLDLAGLRGTGKKQFRDQFSPNFHHGAVGFHHETVRGGKGT